MNQSPKQTQGSPRDPYAGKYVPKENQALVRRANALVAARVSPEAKQNGNGQDSQGRSFIEVVQRSNTCGTPMQARFRKYQIQNRYSDGYAEKQFAELELEKTRLMKKYQSEHAILKQEEKTRKRKWEVRLEKSPFLDDQLAYVQQNEELQKMRMRAIRRRKEEELQRKQFEEEQYQATAAHIKSKSAIVTGTSRQRYFRGAL